MRVFTVGGVVCALAIAIAIAGCDARATSAAAPARSELKSQELESCSATFDCKDGLRCFGQVCRRTDLSLLGDFHAAVANREEAAGRLDAALTAYGEALAAYGTDGLTPPVELDCAYGRALVKGRGDRDRAELAARVLHRCLRGLPPGSPLRHVALRDAAELDDLGLDPQHLKAEKAPDAFLSKQTATPAAAKLTVGVSADPTPPAKAFGSVPGKLQAADLKPALVKCWEAYYAATKSPQLSVTYSLKVKFVTSPDYDDEFKRVVDLDAPSSLSGADATAAACVESVIEPVLKKGDGLRDALQTKLTITIQ